MSPQIFLDDIDTQLQVFQSLMPLRNNITSSPPLLSDHSFDLKSLSKFRRPYLFPINWLGCGPIAEKRCSSVRIRSWTISRSSDSSSSNWTTAGFWTPKAWSQLFPHCLVGPWQPRDRNRHLPRIHCLAEAHFDCGRGYGNALCSGSIFSVIFVGGINHSVFCMFLTWGE